MIEKFVPAKSPRKRSVMFRLVADRISPGFQRLDGDHVSEERTSTTNNVQVGLHSLNVRR